MKLKLPVELERIRLPQKDKDALIALKRRTGIGHWNVLCRWAFLLSLSEPKTPKMKELAADSNIDMGWKTFGGEYDQLLLHLLVERCLVDGLPTESHMLATQFKLHLHRGLGYLSTKGKISSISDLVKTARFPPCPEMPASSTRT